MAVKRPLSDYRSTGHVGEEGILSEKEKLTRRRKTVKLEVWHLCYWPPLHFLFFFYKSAINTLNPLSTLVLSHSEASKAER